MEVLLASFIHGKKDWIDIDVQNIKIEWSIWIYCHSSLLYVICCIIFSLLVLVNLAFSEFDNLLLRSFMVKNITLFCCLSNTDAYILNFDLFFCLNNKCWLSVACLA